MKIEIIHIGDELLTGDIDPYPKTLIETVRGRGANVNLVTVVRDNYDDIMRLLESAEEARVDILIITGGLGPTLDDITRHVVADFLGTELELRDDAVEWFIEAVKKMYGAKPVMTDENMLMAMVPEGATALRNITGAAAGIDALKGEMRIFCLPGFPKEMLPMFEEYILPLIEGEKTFEKEVRGKRGESTMAPLFQEIVRNFRVRIASLPTENWLKEGNRIIIKGDDPDEVERAAMRLLELIEESKDDFILE
ncbi:MAG TPA: competence/damage-inducible protein A [Methanomassiliicoccales archaeon]|nr:competence/damage-inducible protein A [Methanomassiliicoccales archaeon]